MRTGHCLCERVRFEIEGDLGEIAYCHCTSCQKASGTAFAVNSAVQTQNLRWIARDTIREYESSPGKHRSFCTTCGSPIYARYDNNPGWLSIRIGLLDQDPDQRPRAHFNITERAPWYTISDHLPQHPHDQED